MTDDLFSERPFPDYLLVVADELAKSYQFVDVIGSGKTGCTYKIQTRSAGRPYCLKTVSPNVTADSDKSRVRKTLRKEVEILSPLSHRCLPTIYEHNLDGALPYYVCTYHPGSTLEDLRKSNVRLKLDEAVFVIASLIDVLEYVHSRGRTHCDLHQENILLSPRVFAEGLMIIDFGSGHRESDSGDVTPDRGFPDVKGTKGLARFQHDVKRKVHRDDFRANDVRAFGRALALLAECLFSNASHEQRLSYFDFCRLLQEGAFDDWREIREHFDHVVDPDAFITKAERFFVMQNGTRPSITIPPSEQVRVGEAVLAVINTKAFQRLRTIKQLSFCEWYFPGATHSRFEHSLGVFGVAQKALQFLAHDVNIRAQFTQANINATLLASLLHDLGHYPFAHVIEHYVSGRYSTVKETRQAVHHFNHTLLLLDTDAELQQAIEKYWGQDAKEEVKRILQGSIPPLSDILDGPIDCDKLDYLRRDAHHCGVTYGQGLDIGSILRSFRCSPTGNGALLVDSRQVHAIEGFMIVQDQMLTAVYWHETIRAVFAMFHRFLDGALRNDPNLLAEFVRKLKSCTSEYEALNKVVVPLLDSQIDSKLKKELQPLIRLLTVPNFNDIYRAVATYSRLDSISPKHFAPTNVFNSIMQRLDSDATSVPIKWEHVKRLRTCYRQAFVEKGADLGRFDVLVDVPWGKAANRVITVVDETGATRPITDVSHLAESIFTDITAYSAPIRVYINPAVVSQYESVLGSIRISAEERYLSKEKFSDDEEM